MGVWFGVETFRAWGFGIESLPNLHPYDRKMPGPVWTTPASPAAPKAVPQKSMPRPGTRPKGTGNPADAAAGSAAGPPMTKVSLCKGSFLSE